MTIALDPGSHGFRSLRQQGNQLVGRSCRSIYAVIPDNVARRRWLENARIPHLATDGFLVLPGDAADEAAKLFVTASTDLLLSGEVPSSDPIARQALSALIDGLLPVSRDPVEICCFAQPGHHFGDSRQGGAGDIRRQFFARLIRLRGYEPLPLNPATALVLAGLAQTRFTGLGLALGASGADIALVHRGNQIAVIRLSRGGRWIDEQLARKSNAVCRDLLGQEVLDLDSARSLKEAASLERDSFPNQEEQGVSGFYRGLIGELVDALCRMLAAQPLVMSLPQPLAVVCGGGPAKIPGFCDWVQKEFDQRQRPVAGIQVRLAADSQFTVARGCLIHAELEQEALSNARLPGDRHMTTAGGPHREVIDRRIAVG